MERRRELIISGIDLPNTPGSRLPCRTVATELIIAATKEAATGSVVVLGPLPMRRLNLRKPRAEVLLVKCSGGRKPGWGSQREVASWRWRTWIGNERDAG